MKAMIWKEWRENLRWALLAVVALGLAAAYSVWQLHKVFYNGGDYAYTQLLPWMTLGAPLVALALGFLQIVPEQRRDHWAFLLHRPVTRDVIFAGKAVAGLSLYLLATLLPAIVAVVWLATPGHVPAPFDIRMALSGLADILAGIPFYFAAMLTVLRPARWYGSRVLPILTALVGALPGNFGIMGEFLPTAIVSLLFTCVLSIAVWGSFRTSGQYAGQPKVAKTALGTVMYVSIVAVIVAAVIFTLSFQFGNADSSNHRPYSYYDISRSGHILRITQIDQKAVRVTDLTTGVVRKGLDDDMLSGMQSMWAVQDETSDAPGSYRFLGRFYSSLRVNGGPTDVNWYYSFSQRRMLGYSTRSKRLTWVGGTSGVVLATQPFPQPFPKGLRNPNAYNDLSNNLLVFDHVIYTLNLDKLHLAAMVVVAPPEKIDSLTMLSLTDNPGGPPPLLIVTTTHRVQIFNAQNKLLFSVPRYLDSGSHDILTDIYSLPHGDRYFLRYELSEHGQQLLSLLETDAQGRVLKRDTLPPLPETRYGTFSLPFGYGALVPPGLILGPSADTVIYRHIPDTMAAHFAKEIAAHPRAFTVFFIVSGIAGLIGAILAWLIGRRCGWNRVGQWIWTVSVLLLGVYGLLMLLALIPWPAREICPNCGRKRVVTREHCEHCGAPFAPVVPDGTEIFDDVSERVSVA